MATLAETEATATSTVPKLLQKSSNLSSTTTVSETPQKTKRPEFFWMVKPCFIYKEEYKDCKSIRARFHQYFVDGEMSECDHWKQDYDNCKLWEDKDDEEGLKKVIESEKQRVRHRLRSHYLNNVWEHRTSPPPDWNKELPEAIRKGYEGSHLQQKADDLRSGKEKLGRFRDNMYFSADGDVMDKEDSSCTIV